MISIIISPFSQKLREGAVSKDNPKNYPHWQRVIDKLNKIGGHEILQLGVEGEPILYGTIGHKFNSPIEELLDLTDHCDLWMSVDNFFPHFCNFYFPKKTGIVLWGKSDPEIFGYKHNINLLKSRKFLRPNQYNIWECEPYDADCFVGVDSVIRTIGLELNF